MTDKPARLCFSPLNDSSTRQCFDAKDGNEAFPIFVELKLITIRESRSPKSGVLFIAEAAGKVEPTRLITIWTYHSSSGTFQNLLPTIRINLQGEYLIIPKSKEGIEGILITANRIWDAGAGKPIRTPQIHNKHIRPERYRKIRIEKPICDPKELPRIGRCR